MRYTASELEQMRLRGEDRTDWERIENMIEAEIEANADADPDEYPGEFNNGEVIRGLPPFLAEKLEKVK